MMADSTTETWYELVDDTSGGRGVIYTLRTHVVLAEMSHMHIAMNVVGAGVHVHRAGYGPQGPFQTNKQRPRDLYGPWDAGGR